MIFELFGLGVVFGAICLFIGYTQYSFPFAYLGMFVFLLLGMFTMSEGISIATGATAIGHSVVTDYTIFTTANNPMVNVIATTFLYIPMAGVLLSTFFALRGWRSRY